MALDKNSSNMQGGNAFGLAVMMEFRLQQWTIEFTWSFSNVGRNKQILKEYKCRTAVISDHLVPPSVFPVGTCRWHNYLERGGEKMSKANTFKMFGRGRP
ncbi:hypothetical protein SUGI_0733500 [Cryptomeria japonica]|nr:hypothetical protein SUGI_0733500 [Cryptomeria japonica]